MIDTEDAGKGNMFRRNVGEFLSIWRHITDDYILNCYKILFCNVLVSYNFHIYKYIFKLGLFIIFLASLLYFDKKGRDTVLLVCPPPIPLESLKSGAKRDGRY
jgi:hypothetical protein